MNTKTIIYLLVALTLGLLGGYLLFGGSNLSPGPSPEERGDMTSMGDHDHDEAEIWTCSMHPQIQQDGPGDCPLCGMDLIPLETGNSTDPAVLTMTEAAVALARVETVTVGNTGAAAGAMRGTKERGTLTLTGRLAPDERTAAVEVSEYGGRIERLFVSFGGEPVRAGQRIATVYSPDLVVAQEELIQAKNFADVNPELVAAARAKLRNLKVTDEQIAKLEESGEVVENFPVYADRSGTILETKAEVGEYVKPGGALYTYTNLSRLWALFDAYEADLARISVGDPVAFTVPSRPGETYQARVTFIDPVINPTTRTAALRAEVSNRRGRLKPEMFIEGTVTVTPADGPRSPGSQGPADGMTVPRSAVLWTGERSVVYVAIPDTEVPTYEFREVILGERVGDGYQVTAGLEAGDEVVVQGAFQLDAAAQLNNKASMMNRDVVVAGREAEAPTAEAIPDYREETPEAFREQLGKVVEAYLPLKDRMVATETADAALLAPFGEALAGMDMGLVSGAAHDYWMQQLAALRGHADALAERTDVDAQREQFGYLSRALINALTAFGVNGDYYVQHCPMAFDNAGADWISDDEQIRNPYFGDLMLKCGMVTDEL